MTDNYKATPECWEWQEKWASKEVPDEDSSCFLELRARVEALEGQRSEANSIIDYYSLLAAQSKGKAVFHGPSDSREVAESAPVARGLVERVAAAIHPDRCADPNLYLHEARAAILEVARWLREQGWFGAADLFEQEAMPND